MKIISIHIYHFLKNLLLIAVFAGLLMQPISETIALLTENTIELIELDVSEDTEPQEDMSKDEKLKHQFYAIAQNDIFEFLNKSIFLEGLISSDALLEIFIPPPEILS